MSGFVHAVLKVSLENSAMDDEFISIIVVLSRYWDSKVRQLYYLDVISFYFSTKTFSFKISTVIFKTVKRGYKASYQKFIDAVLYRVRYLYFQ